MQTISCYDDQLVQISGMQACIECAELVLEQNNIQLNVTGSVLSPSVAPIAVLACEHLAVVFFKYAEEFLQTLMQVESSEAESSDPESSEAESSDPECIHLVNNVLRTCISSCQKMSHLDDVALPVNQSAFIDAEQLTHFIRQITGTVCSSDSKQNDAAFLENLKKCYALIVRNKEIQKHMQQLAAPSVVVKQSLPKSQLIFKRLAWEHERNKRSVLTPIAEVVESDATASVDQPAEGPALNTPFP